MKSPTAGFEGRSRPLDLLGIGVTGVLASGFFGASTNAANGAACPEYFLNVLQWHDVKDVWRASIAQGILEGLLFGVLVSLVFTASVSLISKARCPYAFAVAHLLGILIVTYIFWALGGLAAMGLASLSPEFYRETFVRGRAGGAHLLGFAWVGGSIWGAYLGGASSVIVGLTVFRTNWKARPNDASR